jgi:hypothetical protein
MTSKGDKFRESAAQHRKDEQDSWERSDTDGFLSQWASGINARLDDVKAEIADADGLGVFERTGLVTLDGEPVESKVVETRYGTKHRIDATDEWLPYQPARESTLAKRGYKEVTIEEVAPAQAMLASPPGARGLSGATSVYVRVFRPDAPKSAGWRYQGPAPKSE